MRNTVLVIQELTAWAGWEREACKAVPWGRGKRKETRIWVSPSQFCGQSGPSRAERSADSLADFRCEIDTRKMVLNEPVLWQANILTVKNKFYLSITPISLSMSSPFMTFPFHSRLMLGIPVYTENWLLLYSYLEFYIMIPLKSIFTLLGLPVNKL